MHDEQPEQEGCRLEEIYKVGRIVSSESCIEIILSFENVIAEIVLYIRGLKLNWGKLS